MRFAKIGLITKSTNVDFFKLTKIFFLISSFLLLISLIFPLFYGYNLGVDFKGGVVVNLANTNNYSLEQIHNTVKSIGITEYSLKEFGKNQFEITLSNSSFDSKKTNEIITNIKSAFSDYTFLQTQFVGPSISYELVKGGLIAISFSLVGIFFYMWLRYDWQFGLVAIIALIHDVMISMLFLAVFAFEVNISTIAAILTIIGYSINDTVVLFDQVRENIKKYVKHDVKMIINKSINQVLSRSIATSLTVFIVLLSIFLFSGNALQSFSFTLLVGVFFGSYSSVCIALPLLYYVGDIRAKYIRQEKNKGNL